MTKKFDVVIGNPPYQDEAQGDGTRDTPIYHQFIDAAYEVGEKAVLITPARFLFNAGFTPKAWNRKMLDDPHLRVPIYARDSSDLFPGTDITGGIAVTYRDRDRVEDAIGTFTSYPELNKILRKVSNAKVKSLRDAGITSSRTYRYTDQLYEEHPDARALRPVGNTALISTNTFEQFSFLYSEEQPSDGSDYITVLGRIGNRRATQWIRSEYVTGPEMFTRYKVAVPKANGSPDLGTIGQPVVLGPYTATTQSFITIGAFNSRPEADRCLAYVSTKFARAMLGVLKITQDNPASTWEHVPLQDFTEDSDIDWSKPVHEIDQQLYAKYGLSDEEIEFIESHVKPMD